MQYNGVELYERDGVIALLVSPGFGAGWSTWVDDRVAYDKRVVEFWMEHNNEKEFICKMNDLHSDVHKEVADLFVSWGYESWRLYFGGFGKIKLCWVFPDDVWRITEYDGSERLETLNDAGFVCFGREK